MYHIAICDDNDKFIAYIEKIIKKVKDKEKYEIKFYEFSSGEELVRNMEGYIQYDLLILDMQLSGMDGDETAKCFREKFPDAVLVFCSGVRPPSIMSFKATPFRYLLKSQTERELIIEMHEILAEVAKNSKELYIIGHYRNNIIRVKIGDILYIENAKRGSRIVVCPRRAGANYEGQILVDEKLQELSEKFVELVFAHSSYIVNVNHVEYANGTELILDSGERLSISRLYQKTFREAFTKNVANKY